MMMELMAPQMVLLSAFKLKLILGINTVHHNDYQDGSGSPENLDRWAASQRVCLLSSRHSYNPASVRWLDSRLSGKGN